MIAVVELVFFALELVHALVGLTMYHQGLGPAFSALQLAAELADSALKLVLTGSSNVLTTVYVLFSQISYFLVVVKFHFADVTVSFVFGFGNHLS